MLDVRWSLHTRADIRRIAGFWLERDPTKVAAVTAAIYRRVNWLADGRQLSGVPVRGLPNNYRWYLERIFGYKIYYRVEGNPPESLSVIAVRHSRQRPLRPPTLRKYGQQ